MIVTIYTTSFWYHMNIVHEALRVFRSSPFPMTLMRGGGSPLNEHVTRCRSTESPEPYYKRESLCDSTRKRVLKHTEKGKQRAFNTPYDKPDFRADHWR